MNYIQKNRKMTVLIAALVIAAGFVYWTHLR